MGLCLLGLRWCVQAARLLTLQLSSKTLRQHVASLHVPTCIYTKLKISTVRRSRELFVFLLFCSFAGSAELQQAGQPTLRHSSTDYSDHKITVTDRTDGKLSGNKGNAIKRLLQRAQRSDFAECNGGSTFPRWAPLYSIAG